MTPSQVVVLNDLNVKGYDLKWSGPGVRTWDFVRIRTKIYSSLRAGTLNFGMIFRVRLKVRASIGTLGPVCLSLLQQWQALLYQLRVELSHLQSHTRVFTFKWSTDSRCCSKRWVMAWAKSSSTSSYWQVRSSRSQWGYSSSSSTWKDSSIKPELSSMMKAKGRVGRWRSRQRRRGLRTFHWDREQTCPVSGSWLQKLRFTWLRPSQVMIRLVFKWCFAQFSSSLLSFSYHFIQTSSPVNRNCFGFKFISDLEVGTNQKLFPNGKISSPYDVWFSKDEESVC